MDRTEQTSQYPDNEQRAAGGVETDFRYYVFGNTIDEVLIMGFRVSSTWVNLYYAHDPLYSPTGIFAPSGMLMERYEYDAYGKVRITGMGPDAAWFTADDVPRTASLYANPYAFTGRELDTLDGASLHLMYYRARTTDPETGRFMQRDPHGINPEGGLRNPFSVRRQYSDGMNIYAYTQENPVLIIDPSGLSGCDAIDGAIDSIPGRIGSEMVSEMAKYFIKYGMNRLREEFPNESEEWDIGAQSCKGGRVRLLKDVITIKTIIELKQFSVLQSKNPIIEDGTYTIHVWERTLRYWTCRCPCSGNFRWNIVKTYKADNESSSSWIEVVDYSPLGPVYSVRTYDKGRRDVYDCDWNIGRVMEWLCK